jgi:hypothetical protein
MIMGKVKEGADMLSTGKIRICVDFQNLNKATPKDEYPMLIADVLINNVPCNKMISFWMVTSDITKSSWKKKCTQQLFIVPGL